MRNQRIFGIAASDPRGVIGRQGTLPWHCPQDLQYFSDTILHHPIIVGSQTFSSLPQRFLVNRTAVVFTRKDPSLLADQKQSAEARGGKILLTTSLSEFFTLGPLHATPYVIGGSQIYTLFLQHRLISVFFLTLLKNVYEGDCFFPRHFLEGWPSLRIRETQDFIILKYLNKRGSRKIP